MSPAVLIAVLLAASPAPRLASPGLNGVQVPAELVTFLGERLATRLHDRGVEVVTSRDIATVLGQERQKQLLGCAEGASSCMAELAGALGADGTVVGDVAKLGTSWHLNLKIISSRGAKVLADYSADAADEQRLLAKIDEAAEEIAEKLMPPKPKGPRTYAWIPAAVGGASLVAGGAFFFDASAKHDLLLNGAGPVDDARANTLIAQGEQSQQIARIGVAIGAAALLTAGVLYLLGAESPVSPGVALVPGGLTFGVAGALP